MKVPKFTKLGTGGNYYNWLNEIQSHFEALGLWDHVSNGVPIVVGEDEDDTPEMRAAITRRDFKLSLHPDLKVVVTGGNKTPWRWAAMKAL